ncbi:stage II sporulation protein R [Salinibacillus xinjiangensis]|uniref:Stage II sporulation protein R n=1 Tax=Salinibacillus xinjiangensis TaxID=1229268 RepID=A0A6G1X5H1_9BACI|nr:stage II sporulation protein R [Salinibacillus xinjiangensis]MRG86214.1 stage II sporulation protein R [Salinibacillus xinjiangensis]
MKKVIFLFVSAFIIFYNPMIGSGKQEQNSEYKVIPDESIRLRILAHSNSEKDQELKREIRDRVNAEITTWVNDLNSISSARELIESRLGEIEKIVEQTLAEKNINQTFDLEFGDVQFPTKVYGGKVYPGGIYEALLITIGDGKGDNWWCVLFPPLCFLDFSNGTTVADDEEKDEHLEENQEVKENEKKVEVQFFLITWFDSIIGWVKNLF